jgi:hypothetical protein
MRFELDVSVMPERYVLRFEGCTLKFESERAAELLQGCWPDRMPS